MLWGLVLSQIGITVIVVLSNIQNVESSTSSPPPNTTSSNSSSCSSLRLANEKCVQQVLNLEGMVLLITDERERYRSLTGTLQQERDYLADKAHRWQIAAEMAADQSGAMELELLELKHRLESAQTELAATRKKAKQEEENDLERGNLVLSGMYRMAVRAQQTAEQSLQETREKLIKTENKLKSLELDIQKEKDNVSQLQLKLDEKDKIIEMDRERLKSLEDILKRLPPTQTGAVAPHNKEILGKEFILSSGRTVLLHQHPQASQLDVPIVPKLTEAVLHSNMFRIPSGFVPRRYPFCDVPTVTLQLTQIILAFTIGSVSMCFIYRSSISRATIKSQSNLSVEMANTSTNTSPTKPLDHPKKSDHNEADNQEFAKALKILANIAENSLLKELGDSHEGSSSPQNKLLSDPDVTFLCSLGDEDFDDITENDESSKSIENDIILSKYLEGLKQREKFLHDQIILLAKQKELLDDQFQVMRVNSRSLDKRAAVLAKRESELNNKEKNANHNTTKNKSQKTDNIKLKELTDREETLKSKWKDYETAIRDFEEEKKKWNYNNLQKNKELEEKILEIDMKTKALVVKQEQINKQENAIKEQQNKLKQLKEREKQITKRQTDCDVLRKSLEHEEEEIEKKRQDLIHKEQYLNSLQTSLVEEKKHIVLQEGKCGNTLMELNQNSELWNSYIEMIWNLLIDADLRYKVMIMELSTEKSDEEGDKEEEEEEDSDKDTKENFITPITQTQRYINESWGLVFDFPDVGCQWIRWNACNIGTVGDVLHFIPEDKKLSERIQLVLSTEELPEGSSALKYKEITINRLFEMFPRNILILDQYSTTVGEHHAFVIRFLQTSPSPMYTFSALVVVSNMVFVWQLIGMASSPDLVVTQQHKIDQLALPMIQSIELGNP